MVNEQKINVLFIDDESDFLKSMAKALDRRGFAVKPVETAAEALLVSNKEIFDVAVIDARLKDGDGHELFLELKKARPDLQGIILTGNRDDNKQFLLSHKGLYEYLDKPCEVDVLAKTISEAHKQGLEEKAPVAIEASGHEDKEPVRVLLIDDEEDFLKSLARVLARRGMTIHTASSGEDGLRILDSEDVDVAVVDLKMPGMSGMEVFGKIKEKKPDVEVIILTGHASVDSGVDGMKQGAADYLFKPQNPDSLARKIHFAALSRTKKRGKKRWWPFGKK